LKGNDPVAHDFIHALEKQNLRSFKSNSIGGITFGEDPGTWDKPLVS
jgi:hypothetical protein